MTPLLPLLTALTLPAAADEGLILVGLDDPARSGRIAETLGARVALEIEEIAVVGLSLDQDADGSEALDTLRATPGVRWAELDQPVSAWAPPDRTTTVGDPLRSAQWNLRRVGTWSAWACAATGADVVVAVLDTGLATGGRDTPAWLPGLDLVDDDTEPTDGNGHGTHVAGTIAQATGNGVGVAGMAPAATILPVRVLDDDGFGTMSAVAAGIVWAASEGASVINLSLGGPSASNTVDEAVAWALGEGAVVVAAAGNDGLDNVSFPAASPGVIAVGATTRTGALASYSNRGPEVDLVAPGGEPYSRQGILQETLSSDGRSMAFREYAGTSMATPHVAAAYAMLLSLGATVEEATQALQETAWDLGEPGPDPLYGAGEIRVGDAAARLLGAEGRPFCR